MSEEGPLARLAPFLVLPTSEGVRSQTGLRGSNLYIVTGGAGLMDDPTEVTSLDTSGEVDKNRRDSVLCQVELTHY